MIFNQFDEFGNYSLAHLGDRSGHRGATRRGDGGGRSLPRRSRSPPDPAGTIGAGDYVKQKFPGSVIAGGEAIQCPTMLFNGFGDHRIEGHRRQSTFPWVHNVKNMDLAIGLDDEAAVALVRLFNEDAGRSYLSEQGVSEEVLERPAVVGDLRSLQCPVYHQAGQVTTR